MELHDKKRLLFNALDKDKRWTFCQCAKTDVTSFDSCSQVSDYLIEWIHDTFKNSLNLSPSRALICSLFIMISFVFMLHGTSRANVMSQWSNLTHCQITSLWRHTCFATNDANREFKSPLFEGFLMVMVIMSMPRTEMAIP